MARFYNIAEYKKYGYGSSHFDYDLLNEFISKNNIVKYSDYHDLKQLREVLSRGSYRGIRITEHRRNWNLHEDHVIIFKSEDGRCFYTSQPYYDIDGVKESINQWCQINGLKATYFDKNRSWYYKNETILVVITLPDVQVNY